MKGESMKALGTVCLLLSPTALEIALVTKTAWVCFIALAIAMIPTVLFAYLLDKWKGNKTLCAVLLVVGIWEMSNVCWALALIN